LETHQGAWPPGPPVGGAAPDTPFVGLCPTPRQGLRPCTPQGPLALDPSPRNPKGFRGCFYLKQSYIFGLSLPVQPGGFPIAPWTPSDASSLIWPLTHYPKPKGLGDCLCVGLSFEGMFFVQGGVSPSRATKGLSDRPLETFGFPPDEGISTCLLEERCLVLLVTKSE